jgi:hypothetical protein
MKQFVYTIFILATLALGSIALADATTHVITGRVLELNEVSIVVQSGKERLEINSQLAKYIGKPRVGDTVTVHYTGGHHHYRMDPEYEASKIEVNAAGGSKK